ncbi:hypothetical protein AWZ03_007544 [Drosophila navojoa]|uniref:Uncharacterized protein n=1 Tax=Drosophila navojoa TaxID=7232 RepID=A0A484BB30_DRONA|nr:hypothetical protein AWZ03_007544 [Drosophila navojoa]
MTNTQPRAPSLSACLPSSGPSAAALAGHQFSFWTRAQLLLQDKQQQQQQQQKKKKQEQQQHQQLRRRVLRGGKRVGG